MQVVKLLCLHATVRPAHEKLLLHENSSFFKKIQPQLSNTPHVYKDKLKWRTNTLQVFLGVHGSLMA